jgi:hypothetical protein
MALFDAPEKPLTLVRSHKLTPLDPSKETMILVYSRLVFSKEQDHIIGWHRQFVKEVLAPQYNLIWVGVDNDPSRIIDMGYTNVYNIHSADFETIKAKKLKRSKEMAEDAENASWEYNRDVILGHFEKELPNVSPEHVLWLDERSAFLPLKDYWNKKHATTKEADAINSGNEFHDYTGDDQEVINKIRTITREVSEKYDYHVGILTFTYWMKNLTYNLGKWFINKGVSSGTFKKSYYFVIDPGSYYRLFDAISPNHSNYAMAEDFRGTRDFEFFPIQEMQHFLYEKPWTVEKTKKRKFCFYGTIFLSKGNRKPLWDTYLRELKGDGIDIYVPPRVDGHIAERKKEGNSIARLNERIKEDTEISELTDSVFNHPRYQGYLDNQELNSVLAQYEYALIAKNIARYDSVNFRPALYVSLDVFPLLDFRYDPDCKGIPAEIQEKIVVRSHKDIEDKMAYYDAHPEEKAQVMEDLRTHFGFRNFTEEWKEIIKKSLATKTYVSAQ